jgi:uncharacterized protein with gpF-like domain
MKKNKELYRANIEALSTKAKILLARRMQASINSFIREYAKEYRLDNRFNDYELFKKHRQNTYNFLTAGYKKVIPSVSKFVFDDVINTFENNKKQALINTFSRQAIEYIEEFGLIKSQTIANSSRRKVQQKIALGVIEGLSVDEIAENIIGVQAITGARALTIARTETLQALSFASHTTAENIEDEFNVKLMKEWISAGDERTRHDHSDANGQVRELNQPFDVGGEQLDMPRDIRGSAENVINCRCVEIYTRI